MHPSYSPVTWINYSFLASQIMLDLGRAHFASLPAADNLLSHLYTAGSLAGDISFLSLFSYMK